MTRVRSGIGWVSELVEIAAGIDIFADRRNQGAAKDRILTPEEVIARVRPVTFLSVIYKSCRRKIDSGKSLALS